MSQVLDFVRSKDPRFKKVPDAELTRFLAETQPDFLEDPEFAGEFEKLHASEVPSEDPPPPPEEPTASTEPVTYAPVLGSELDAQAATAATKWGMTQPDPKPKVSHEEIEAAKVWWDGARELAGEDVGKIAMVERSRKAHLAQLGIETIPPAGNPLKIIGKPIGLAIDRGTKISRAAIGDAGHKLVGMEPTNLKSFANDPDAPLPIEEAVADADQWWERGMGYASMAGASAPVILGAAGGLTRLGAVAGLGVQPEIANALVMGFDKKGDIEPVGMLAALGLPAVDQAGRYYTAKHIVTQMAKAKTIYQELAGSPGEFSKFVHNQHWFSKLPPGLKRDELLKAIEIGGGQLLSNAYLLALSTPGILMAEDKGEALLNAIASNLPLALMGAGELKGGDLSMTSQVMNAAVRQGKLRNFEVRPAEQAQLPAGPPTPPPPPDVRPAPGPPYVEPNQTFGTKPAPPPEPGEPGATLPPDPPAPAPAPRPAPVAALGSPDPTDPEVILGRPTVVRGANDSKFPALYAWVPQERIHSSHLAGFAVNPAYAPLENTRDYTQVPEQEKVMHGATTFDAGSYASNVRSAADGPIMVSRSSDGLYRVLGGNGRLQMIQALQPDQRKELDTVQDAEAAAFGLPVRPSGDLLLVRLLPPIDLAQPENIPHAKRVVDLLNPSPGLVETTASMAKNDALKVDPAALTKLPVDLTPAAAKEWARAEIGAGRLDRNTRTQILGNDNQALDYVQRLRLHAAYPDDAVVELAQSPRTGSTPRMMITAPMGALIALRQQGATTLARSIGEMVRTVAEYRNDTGMDLPEALKQFYGQDVTHPTLEQKIARNMAAVLADKIELLPENTRGKRWVDHVETQANFQSFYDAMALAVKAADAVPDLLGQTRTPVESVMELLRREMGDNPEVRDESDGGYSVRPNADVKRLNHLTSEGRKRKLTTAEETERAAIEARLGQNFMTFWSESKGREQEANPELTKMQIKAGQNKKLSGADIKTQGDMFGPVSEEGGGGQFTLLEPHRRYHVKHGKAPIEVSLEVRSVESVQGGSGGGTGGPPPNAPGAAGSSDGGVRWVHRMPSPPVPGLEIVVAQIKAELIQAGQIDIVGRKIRSDAEAAVLFQVLRQPQFEIFHWIFKLGDDVVGRHSITLRLPARSRIFLSGENLADIRQRMLALGATSYHLVHNQPSDNIKPSDKDLAATKYVADHLPGFLSHIVINHTKYAVVGRNLDWTENSLPAGTYSPADPLLVPPPAAYSGIIGQEIRGSLDLFKMEDALRNNLDQGLIQIMLVTVARRVRAIVNIDPKFLKSPGMLDHLRAVALNQGSYYGLACYMGNDPSVQARLRSLVKEGALRDAFLMETHTAESVRDTLVDAPPRTFLGQPDEVEPGAMEVREPNHEDPPTYEFQYGPLDKKTGEVPKVATYLGHLDKIRPAEMPEMVRIARSLLGHVPQIRRLPGARGVFSTAGAGGPTIKLSPQIFVDPRQAARTLAHELFHLVDYLPEATLARGNLFGRIASLRQWMATTFPIESTTPITEVITSKDRSRLRYAAEKEVGPRPTEAADITAWQELVRESYREKLAEEIKRRGLTTIDVIRSEAWELSKEWRPLPKGEVPEAYLAYRQSSVELYADFGSALLNSPGLAEEHAPLFFQMFWDYLDKKPEVHQQLTELQDLLFSGRLKTLEQRDSDTSAMFKSGEAKMRAAAEARELRRTSWKGFWNQLGNDLIDRFWTARGKAAKAGDLKTIEVLDELGMRDNVNMAFIRQVFDKVVKPAEDQGFTLDDLGNVLFHERIMAGDRSIVANPLGHTPLTSRAALWHLRHQIGLEGWTNLHRLVDTFHREVYRVVERAVEAGVYNRETFETLIKPNKDTYAAFSVIDYLEDYVPPSIRRQVGTFKDIANPLVATLFKTVALNNLITWNRAKTTVRDMLQRSFPAEIVPAEVVGPPTAPRAKAHPDHGILSPLVNGRPQHWYVDPFIAQAFEELPPLPLAGVVRAMDTAFRGVLYPLIISYNPGFLFITSPIREVRRTGRNLPVHFGRAKLLLEYTRVWKDVVKRYRGESTALTREMEGTLALASPFETVTGFHRDDALGRMLERYKLMKPAEAAGWRQKWIGQQVMRLAHGIEFWGMVVDSLPKYGAYNIHKREIGQGPKEAGNWVRSYAGLPNIKNKGAARGLMRAIIPFWNVFAQGWRADARLMTQPKTRGGYWMRWMLNEGGWTILQALGAAGLLGAAIKAMFDGISEYKKTNFTVVPLGTVAGGEFGAKTVYLQIPRDETDRAVSGMAYKLITSLAGTKQTSLGQDASDLLAFGSGQVPGLNPVMTITEKWADYARNIPPIDPTTGRPIIGHREWDAGGIDSLKPMAGWTLQQGRLNVFSYDTRQNSTVEMALNALPIVNRFVQITDYGHREQQRAGTEAEKRRDARRTLTYSIDVQGLIGEYNHLHGLPAEKRTQQQTTRLSEIAPWYHQSYRVKDEAIEQANEDRDASTANSERRALNESALEFNK